MKHRKPRDFDEIYSGHKYPITTQESHYICIKRWGHAALRSVYFWGQMREKDKCKPKHIMVMNWDTFCIPKPKKKGYNK